MTLLSCLSAPKTEERVTTRSECSAIKPIMAESCTQTDLPGVAWLEEALAVSEQAMATKRSPELHLDALKVSTPRSPRMMRKQGSTTERVSSSRISGNMLESPSSMQPSQDPSHVETLLVASELAHDDGGIHVKAELKRVFLEFAQFGTRSEAKAMDVYRFSKLCRECDLLPRPQDTSSINLIFYKCKGSKTSKMTFGQFKLALKLIAESLDWELHAVHERVAQSDGPLVNNITLPQYVKQHDHHASGHSPVASRRTSMSHSFLGGMGGGSMMVATPTAALSPIGGSRSFSQMGGGMRTPSSATRRARTSAGASMARKAATAPVGAWR